MGLLVAPMIVGSKLLELSPAGYRNARSLRTGRLV